MVSTLLLAAPTAPAAPARLDPVSGAPAPRISEQADPAQHGNSETVDHGVHQES